MDSYNKLLNSLPPDYKPNSNGGALYAHLKALASIDDDLLGQINNAEQDTGLNGTTGVMVDFFARRTGLYRLPNESDSALINRIIAQFKKRNDPASFLKYLKLYNPQVYGVYENGGNGVAVNMKFDNYNYTREDVTAIFNRDSTAYDYNGNQISQNQAAFTPTIKGQAALIWQNTANVLTENQSSGETDLTGFTAVNGAVLARDNSYAWHGSYSIKVATPGTVENEGIKLSFSGSVNTVYTGRLHIRGNGNIQVQMVNTDNNIYGDIKTIDVSELSWQDIEGFSILCLSGNVDLTITTTSKQAVTFWIDGIQAEAGLYATPWTLGGFTRSADILEYPTQRIFNVSQGCIRIALLQHEGTYDTNNYRYVFSHSTGDNKNVISIRHTPDGYWQLWFSDNSGNSIYINAPDKDVQPVPYSSMYSTIDNLIQFSVNYSSSLIEFWINGVLMAKVQNPQYIPSSSASNVYIGSWVDGTGQINGEIFKIEFSPCIRQGAYISMFDSTVDDTLLEDGISSFKAGYTINNLTGHIPSNYEGAAYYETILGAGSQGYQSFYNQSYYDNMYFNSNLDSHQVQYITNAVLKQSKIAGIIPVFN